MDPGSFSSPLLKHSVLGQVYHSLSKFSANVYEASPVLTISIPEGYVH